MLVLKILGIIALLGSILATLHFFNEHCDKKFSYRFFTETSFWATAGTLALLIIGNWWRINALELGGDALNGIMVMCIGIVIALGLIYFNFKRTNLAYGLGGSALQISAFGILAYIGLAVLMIGLVLWVLSSLSTQNMRS